MRYLKKSPQSPIIANGWQYEKQSDRPNIRDALKREQMGFCAYSEEYLSPITQVEIEHFDPDLKETAADSYWNWYAVISWMNSHKSKKIAPYKPILNPSSPDITQRIKYEKGLFVTTDSNDREAKNLIDFLGWNRPEVCEARRAHVSRIRDLQQLCGDDPLFFDTLIHHPENLSFFSALQVELGIPESLLAQLENRKTP
jgi:hypothetical protein